MFHWDNFTKVAKNLNKIRKQKSYSEFHLKIQTNWFPLAIFTENMIEFTQNLARSLPKFNFKIQTQPRALREAEKRASSSEEHCCASCDRNIKAPARGSLLIAHPEGPSHRHRARKSKKGLVASISRTAVPKAGPVTCRDSYNKKSPSELNWRQFIAPQS